MNKYKNKMIINQRGGSIAIDNTTDQESVQISHRSGSGVLLNNLVNSELATNNKQVLVNNDNFEDTKNDKVTNVSNDHTLKVGRNSYSIKGFKDLSELQAHETWKEIFENVALVNSKFKIKRGGESYPNGLIFDKEGKRSKNPTLNNNIISVDNEFKGYTGIPVRTNDIDEVAFYVKVANKDDIKVADTKNPIKEELEKSGGEIGAESPGILKYGGEASASTEGGEWLDDEDAQKINELALKKQEELSIIEKELGDGGDHIEFTKRSKFETVGATFNDYPSIRVDPEGRSQPLEMLVADTGVFKNHDAFPLVEELDNSSNFPCGDDIKIIGNSYRRNVGSGGVSLKTTGAMEFGAALLSIGGKRIHINANLGLHLASESCVEIQSLKSVILRSNRQILIESSMGVKDNVIIGGGAYIEGETYLHHVTAPLEVQQTEDTIVYGQFNALEDRSLLIGETLIAGEWYPVYAKASPNIIGTYPHSHHFNNIPLRFTASNNNLRDIAQREGINRRHFKSQALPVIHSKKLAIRTN